MIVQNMNTSYQMQEEEDISGQSELASTSNEEMLNVYWLFV